jgi:hypothetical protein
MVLRLEDDPDDAKLALGAPVSTAGAASSSPEQNLVVKGPTSCDPEDLIMLSILPLG